MSAGFEIRPLDNSHSPAIIDLILPIQQVEFQVPVSLGDQPDLLDIEAFYIRGGGQFWGAFHGDRLIGTIALLNAGDGIAAIRKMFVVKDWRGKESGVAQQLLETLFGFCRQQGFAEIYLGTVPQLKAAHRFYEKNGFSPVPAAELPPAFPRMKADHLFYHLRL